MKNLIVVLIILFGISLIAAGVESKYYHSYVTAKKPAILNGVPDKEYWPNTKFCKINSQIAIPGLFILVTIDALI